MQRKYSAISQSSVTVTTGVVIVRTTTTVVIMGVT